jgi:hypothetical protein
MKKGGGDQKEREKVKEGVKNGEEEKKREIRRNGI